MMASMPVALIPYLQNNRVAAPSRRPRAVSSSLPAGLAMERFAEDDLLMTAVNRIAAKSSSRMFSA
jgi:hypothetical protein